MTRQILQELIKSIPDILGFPHDPGFPDAVESLRDLPVPRLIEAFGEILKDPDASVALGIVRAIGILELDGTQDLLLQLVDEPGKWFSHDDRAAIRNAAVESIGIVGDEDAVEPLLDLIGSTQESELEMEVVRAIGRIGSESAIRPLTGLMRDRAEIALSAAGVLVEIGGEEAFQCLLDALTSDSEILRSASIWALGKMRDERAVTNLMTFTEINDPMTRRDIAWALGQIGGFHARLALGAIALADHDITVRREALKAIRAGTVLGRYREDQ